MDTRCQARQAVTYGPPSTLLLQECRKHLSPQHFLSRIRKVEKPGLTIFPFSGDGSGKMTVRGCALDSGTLTTDTEIIRMSHCGSFYFNEK